MKYRQPISEAPSRASSSAGCSTGAFAWGAAATLISASRASAWASRSSFSDRRRFHRGDGCRTLWVYLIRALETSEQGHRFHPGQSSRPRHRPTRGPPGQRAFGSVPLQPATRRRLLAPVSLPRPKPVPATQTMLPQDRRDRPLLQAHRQPRPVVLLLVLPRALPGDASGALPAAVISWARRSDPESSQTAPTGMV